MEATLTDKHLIGINGLGRIGKLLLWNLIADGHFTGAVVNLGRESGKDISDIAHMLGTDSTYGKMDAFLYGRKGRDSGFSVIDGEQDMLACGSFLVKVLRKHRNPSDIGWGNRNVKIVVDCTGVFSDPTSPPGEGRGSLRGHLESGAQKVLLSAPFKIKDKTLALPSDSFMMVFGINHLDYDPSRHHVLSAASCTTTGLSHMMLPLLQSEPTSQILTASMSTVHAATNSQSVLDSVPSAGASDLRKTRSVFNNIILSSTGAAKALESILPQISNIGFMADSVRIPTNTVSLIILNITFSAGLDGKSDPVINKRFINDLYRQAASGAQQGLLVYSNHQNVSADLLGYEAAVVIEGHETHTRTGFVPLPQYLLASLGIQNPKAIELPVTHAKIFGWYDNEYGSYVTSLGKLLKYIDHSLV